MQEERASHPELRRASREIRQELREKQRDLSRSLNYPKLSQPSEQALYNRSWLMPAIHIAVSIPAFQTVPSLARTFGVRRKDILQALQDLEELRLVRKKSNHRWEMSGQFLHLDTQSPFFATHHINWRFRSAICFRLRRHRNSTAKTAHIESMVLPDLFPIFNHLDDLGALPANEAQTIRVGCDPEEVPKPTPGRKISLCSHHKMVTIVTARTGWLFGQFPLPFLLRRGRHHPATQNCGLDS